MLCGAGTCRGAGAGDRGAQADQEDQVGNKTIFLIFGRHLNIKIYAHADFFNMKCDFNFRELRQIQIYNKTG